MTQMVISQPVLKAVSFIESHHAASIILTLIIVKVQQIFTTTVITFKLICVHTIFLRTARYSQQRISCQQAIRHRKQNNSQKWPCSIAAAVHSHIFACILVCNVKVVQLITVFLNVFYPSSPQVAMLLYKVHLIVNEIKSRPYRPTMKTSFRCRHLFL